MLNSSYRSVHAVISQGRISRSRNIGTLGHTVRCHVMLSNLVAIHPPDYFYNIVTYAVLVLFSLFVRTGAMNRGIDS